MESTLKPKQGDDPHDFPVVASGGVPVVPAPEPLASLSPDALRRSSDPQTQTAAGFAAAPPVRPVDATFRPAAVADVEVPGQRRRIGGSALRVFVGLLLTAGVLVVAWQSYGDVAKQMIATWAPPSALISWLPLDKLGLAERPPSLAAAPDATQAVAPQAAAPAAVAAAPPVGVSADSAQLLQSMAHDLAGVGQQIDQLRASIEQLRAGQDQMARDVAKVSEKASEKVSRIAAPLPPPMPPRPVAPRPRRPLPYALPQAATAPAAPSYPPPRQPQPPPDVANAPPPDPELSSAPRPPMPLH